MIKDRQTGDSSSTPSVIVVLNWLQELKGKVR